MPPLISLQKSMSGARRALAGKVGPWAAGLAGAAVFVLRFGAGPAWPGHHAWLLASADSATSWLGWLYFRREAWSLPLGRISGYLHPDGTTIALTDSLPLLALPGKALAFLLPAGFQYFGGWLLLAHMLQAVFAWLLARRLLPGRGTAAACAGAVLLFLSPAFLDRHGHISLSAHWLLLAAFWLYLAPAATGFAPRRLGAWAALTAITCLTHTYLALMVMALGAAWAVRDAAGRTLKPAGAILALFAMAGTALLCWFGVGFLQLGDVAGSSATEYGRSYLNLNFAWNGLGRTLLLPARPLAVENDFESFNALGLGLLLLVGGALGGLRKPAHRPAWRRHLPLAAVLLGCLLFAQGGQLVLDDRQLAAWPQPGWFAALAGPFRASARFVWPWHYGLVLAALALWGRAAPRRLLAPALLVLALVQTVDVWPLLGQRNAYAARTWSTRLRSPQWDRALAGADALLTYPPNLKNTVMDDDFIDLAVLALQHDLPTSAGYAARQFQSHREEGVRSLQALLHGRPDPRAPLVLRNAYFAARYPELQDRYLCTNLDGFVVCFARDGGYRPERAYSVAGTNLARLLEQTGGDLVVLAGKGDLRAGLGDEDRAWLRARGSRIDELPPGGSYAAVLAGGNLVFEQMQAATTIAIEGVRGTALGPFTLVHDLDILAAGGEDGAASVLVDGREVLFNLEGLNLVVLGPDQEVLAVAVCARPDGAPGVVYTLGAP